MIIGHAVGYLVENGIPENNTLTMVLTSLALFAILNCGTIFTLDALLNLNVFLLASCGILLQNGVLQREKGKTPRILQMVFLHCLSRSSSCYLYTCFGVTATIILKGQPRLRLFFCSLSGKNAFYPKRLDIY